MSARSALTIPPAAQLAPLVAAYDGAVAAKRRQMLLGIAVLIACVAAAGWQAEVRPATFIGKIGNFTSYFDRLLTLDTGQRVWTDLAEWFWGLRRWSLSIAETTLIAYVATVLGALFGFAGAVLSNRQLTGSAAVRFATLRFLEFGRTVPDIVFALIFVVAFGLGPMAGVMAIGLHTAGALGKQFSEAIDNIDIKPIDGVRASGASWVSAIRFGVLPQVLSNFASYALLRFEINVRGATVIGIVGAGGLGQELYTSIRRFFYSDVSAILILIIAVVMVIDTISEQLRHRLLEQEAGR